MTQREADIWCLIAKDAVGAVILIASLCVAYVGLDLAAAAFQHAQGY